MIVENNEKLFGRFSLVCDGCGAVETSVGFDTREELHDFHFTSAHLRGRLSWVTDGVKHWCPTCRVNGW